MQQLLEKRGRAALDLAKRSVFDEKIHSREILEALKHFFEYWNDVARPSLISVCCNAVGGNSSLTIPFAASITLICGATDVHDDIIDKSKRKLGHLTIYGRFGQEIALLVGDFLLFKGFFVLRRAAENVSQEKMMHIYDIIANLLFEMGYGEALELKFRGKLDVRPKEYLSLVKMKAADIEACARIGAVLGDGTVEQINALGEYGRILGTIIILRDDLADSVDPQEAPCRFKNESFPLPILIASQDPKIRSDLRSIIFDRKITTEKIEKISQIIHRKGIVEKVEKMIDKLYRQAYLYIREIPNKDDLRLLMDAAISL